MKTKLEKLREIEGFGSVEEMLENSITDSVVPGICSAPKCDYTTDVEPDQQYGYCEACGTTTVQSAFVLAGVI